nr:MAG TPA: hypothetical protein [Caudoviricetes sp.]
MRFIKLIVDINKSIFQTNHLFCNFGTDIDVGQLDNFLLHSKQKNRKHKPAVKTTRTIF